MKDKQKLMAAGLDRLAPLKPVGLEIRAGHWSAPAEALAVFGSGRLPGEATLAPHGLRPYKARCWP
jgi:hypothetical protein